MDFADGSSDTRYRRQIVARLSSDCRQIVAILSSDCRQIVVRSLSHCRQIVVRSSSDCRQIVVRLSSDCRQIVVRSSSDCLWNKIPIRKICCYDHSRRQAVARVFFIMYERKGRELRRVWRLWYEPVSQSCAVAKTKTFWRATGKSDRGKDCSIRQSAAV